MLNLARRSLLGSAIVLAMVLLSFAGALVQPASAQILSFRDLPLAAQQAIERRLGVTVDSVGAPATYFQRPELTASDGTSGDQFGLTVAVSGDGNTVVAASQLKTVNQEDQRGQVYVFVKPASGWTGGLHESARLIASDGHGGDWLGSGLAVSGDGSIIVAGAECHTVGSNPAQGEVYVFVRPSGGWSGALQETARLAASDGKSYDYFGVAVAISADGNTIVAGAPGHAVGTTEYPGAAYVFVKPCNVSFCGWVTNTQTAMLYATDGKNGDGFGGSVAVSADGETIVVGARHHTFGAGYTNREGTAYVFVNPHVAGGWPPSKWQDAELEASDRAASDAFGTSVAISGNGGVIAVGAPNHRVAGHSYQGEAYVFLRTSSGWSGIRQENSRLTASDGAANDEFGHVAISEDGNRLAVGAPYRDVGSNGDQGQVYVYAPCQPDSTWCVQWFFPAEIAKLVASEGQSLDHFGYVGINGDGKTIAVGAPLHTVGNAAPGAAYVFLDLNATYLPMIRR